MLLGLTEPGFKTNKMEEAEESSLLEEIGPIIALLLALLVWITALQIWSWYHDSIAPLSKWKLCIVVMHPIFISMTIDGYDTVKLNSYDDHCNGYAACKDFMHP